MYKKTKKILYLTIVIFLTVGVCFVSGCIDNNDDNNQENLNRNSGETEKITITDSMGRNVEIPKNPKRIAVSGSGSGRYFGYLKETDRIVAIDYHESGNVVREGETRPYAIANPEYLEKTVLGTSKDVVDAERLLAVNPDVLFMMESGPDSKNSAEKIQDKTGIPVILFYSGDYVRNSDRVDESLRIIGKALECEQRAEEVIKFFSDTKNDLIERTRDIPEIEKRTVYVGGISYKGSHGLDGTDPTYLPFTVLHAKNVAAEMIDDVLAESGYAKVSKEKIIEWNPDIIFIDLYTKNAAGGGAIVELKTDPVYKDMKAVKTGEVYALNPHTSRGTNHETSLANAYYVGKVLYPEQFRDIDPEKKADEIYEFVIGKPVYNELKENMDGMSYQKIIL